ncbi:mannan-binding lectin serine protease 1-like [Condylostylus longicornis]|uniref:mannan-binding lectin serine protease 1-like n=1 Tax=Condylostylus longicornis TaxID=2530218 RepID=UPI00244E5AC1|nr:mannan-binding lectin serine protease 1-like [Condylostylus longicornis]
MKQEYIFSYFILTIFIPHCRVDAKRCKSFEYRFINHKVFCEADYGVTTSCLGQPFPVKRAHVMCENKYHNDQNISMLTIECLTNGTWSEEIFKCRAECDDTNIEFNVISNPKVEYPPWYVEIVKLTSNGVVEEIYPGIILSERRILAQKKYFKDLERKYIKENFQIRIPRLKYNKPKEYAINFAEDKFNELIYVSVGNEKDIVEKTTVIYIHFKDYIRYDDVVLPACDETYSDKDKETLKLLHFEKRLKDIWWYEYVLPKYNYYENNCLVPHINRTGTELACFQNNGNPTECLSRANIVLLRCHIGYEQKIFPEDDYIDKCRFANDWANDLEEGNDCNLICGEISESFHRKQVPLIYRGDETHNGFAPWHVAVYYKEEKTINQICGGSIIHSNIILSAAHCFYNEVFEKVGDPLSYLIGAGKFYRQYERREESEFYSNVKSIHIPETYEPYPLRDDIAVLILDHHMKYTPNIKPVCTDFSSKTIPGNLDGQIVGWGAKSAENNMSNKLLAANLRTLTSSECKIVVGPKYKSEVTNDKFCAINEHSSTACAGDSGGGYVVKKFINNKERYYLLGVISSGINSEKYCTAGFTTVLTNISLYKDFIQNITNVGRNSIFFEKHIREIFLNNTLVVKILNNRN